VRAFRAKQTGLFRRSALKAALPRLAQQKHSRTPSPRLPARSPINVVRALYPTKDEGCASQGAGARPKRAGRNPSRRQHEMKIPGRPRRESGKAITIRGITMADIPCGICFPDGGAVPRRPDNRHPHSRGGDHDLPNPGGRAEVNSTTSPSRWLAVRWDLTSRRRSASPTG